LVLTLTIATAGVAAWAWSQRKDAEEENDHEPDLDYENADYGDNPPYGSSRDYRPPPNQGGPPPQQPGPDGYQAVTDGPGDPSQAGWGARMSGALRRTPSPQQFFDSAGKTVAGGVAAAGAVMGKALASIREEDKQYGDRNPWSEEADAKKDRSVPASGKRRKTVALIVSADSKSTEFPEDTFQEHAVSTVLECEERAKLIQYSPFYHTSPVTTTLLRSSFSFSSMRLVSRTPGLILLPVISRLLRWHLLTLTLDTTKLKHLATKPKTQCK
jgi:hypothetical protein